MKQLHPHKKTILNQQVLCALSLAVISQSALATPGQSQLSTLQTWLTIGGGIVITIAMMYVALQMAWKKTPFQEISHVFWGGILFGSAPMIAAMLITG